MLGGRYRLDRLIATGGMAQVWEATDEVLARRVAVKVLHPHLAADESFVARFRREAVAAARLSHPSIVSIYDTCSEDDCEAIVMELVQGSTLRELLDERKWLEPGQAITIIAEVADALETAHQGGVVHRDV
ncbi:MAG: eukaryotic-like serine/threonine-protein kinase, partial [Acidimicrobiaceae bacterium]